jgi:hypothetical protein
MRVAATIHAAREFLKSATYALGQHHMRAFADNLFSETELMAKGILLMDPDENILTRNTLPSLEGLTARARGATPTRVTSSF